MREKDTTTSSGFGAQRSGRLTPADVQQKEFRVSFRGYNERDVDEFLDLVTEELQRYETELMRARSERASIDPATLDVDEETRRTLRDAQERADAIVREAEARAAGIPTASATDARSVVAPYLNREREFLQSLGTLVQGHANVIKTMVEEARRRTESVAPARPAGARDSLPATSAPSPTARPEGTAPAAPAERPERPSDGGPERTSKQDVVVVGEEETVAARPERSRDEAEDPRSLRDLFWGQD